MKVEILNLLRPNGTDTDKELAKLCSENWEMRHAPVFVENNKNGLGAVPTGYLFLFSLIRETNKH